MPLTKRQGDEKDQVLCLHIGLNYNLGGNNLYKTKDANGAVPGIIGGVVGFVSGGAVVYAILRHQK